MESRPSQSPNPSPRSNKTDLKLWMAQWPAVCQKPRQCPCPLLGPSSAPSCSILCVDNNSPARWRSMASGPCEPITHAVGPCRAVGRRPGNWPKPHAPPLALSCPALSCVNLLLPSAGAQASFSMAGPPRVPGAGTSPRGQAESPGDTASSGLREETGKAWAQQEDAGHHTSHVAGTDSSAELASRQTSIAPAVGLSVPAPPALSLMGERRSPSRVGNAGLI